MTKAQLDDFESLLEETLSKTYSVADIVEGTVLKKENGKLIIVGFFLKNSQTGNREYNSMTNRSFVLNPENDNKTIEQIFNILENKLAKNK